MFPKVLNITTFSFCILVILLVEATFTVLGTSWIPKRNPLFTSVRFVDQKHGWISGSKGVFYSQDGGETWIKQPVQVALSSDKVWAGNNLIVGKLVHCDAQSALVLTRKGFVSGNGSTAKWSLVKSAQPIPKLEDVSFCDWSHGWGITANEVLTTKDGGRSWLRKYKFSGFLSSISSISRDRAWVSGLAEAIIFTHDGGESWQQVRFKETDLSYFTRIHFIDQNIGWLLTSNGCMLRSRDAGLNWERMDSSATRGTSLYAISFANSTHGWVVGDTTIYYTQDGGQVWVEQEKHIKDVLLDVCALPNGRGWTVGTMGSILTTADFGRKWVFWNLSWNFKQAR
jgi:photosystem II stability/assembly factor-like uncharacterized protein